MNNPLVMLENACSTGDTGSIPGLGRSPGEGNGSLLQYFLPGKSQGERSLVAQVHSVARVRLDLATKLSHTTEVEDRQETK